MKVEWSHVSGTTVWLAVFFATFGITGLLSYPLWLGLIAGNVLAYCAEHEWNLAKDRRGEDRDAHRP